MKATCWAIAGIIACILLACVLGSATDAHNQHATGCTTGVTS